jgi:hypothetical protein
MKWISSVQTTLIVPWRKPACVQEMRIYTIGVALVPRGVRWRQSHGWNSCFQPNKPRFKHRPIFCAGQPFELTHEPMPCNGFASEGICNSVAQRWRRGRVGFSELLSCVPRSAVRIVFAPVEWLEFQSVQIFFGFSQFRQFSSDTTGRSASRSF